MEATGRAVRFGVIGPLLIEWQGQRIPVPRSGVLRGLLGTLLLAESGPISAGRLSEFVWERKLDGSGHGAVQVGISRLRAWLASVLPESAVRLDHGTGGYRLQVEPTALDLSYLRRLVSLAERTTDDGERYGLLRRAVQLCRGPILADLTHLDGSDPLIRSGWNAVRAAAVAFAEVALHAGEPHSAIALMETLADETPLDEPVQAGLLRLLAADGRPAEALMRYERLRVRLADELGASPSDDLQAIHRRILRGSNSNVETAAPARPGRHVSASLRPCLLPPDVADFTGRRDEIGFLRDLLVPAQAPSSVPIALVTGPGGMGKSTLALHVAHQLRGHFEDGQLYVDLHGTEKAQAHPSDVLARFLISLGVSGRSLPRGLDRRAETFRAAVADRRLLVVLDNAASLSQVRPLLPGSPTCAVLVTSRSPLAGPGSGSLRLDVFDHEAAVELLAKASGCERVAADRDAADSIAELCGRLPLAIRIVGARLAARTHWPLSRMAERLADERRRLDELESDDLAVRVSLDTSYEALTDELKRTFRLLGLLRVPDFASWVPAAMLGISVDEAEAHLDALIDAQLLACSGVDAAGRLRYYFHDLVRLYARDRSADEDHPDECDIAAQRALAAWLARAESADLAIPERVAAEVAGPEGRPLPQPRQRTEPGALAWFTSERGALAACVAHAAASGWHETAWQLCARTVNYFAFRGFYDDWLNTHEAALLACSSAGDRRGEAVLLRNLGCLRMTGVRTSSGTVVSRAESALDTFRALGDPFGEVDMMALLAFAHRHRGDRDGAMSLVTRALPVAESLGYHLGQGRLWYLRAVIAREQGHRVDAASFAERCLALAGRGGTLHDRVLAMWELALVHPDASGTERQLGRLVQECERRREILLEAYLQLALGQLRLRFGEPVAAARIESSLGVFRAQAVLYGQVVGIRVLGELDLLQDRPDAAIERLASALQLTCRLGNTYERALVSKLLGAAYLAAGSRGRARLTWEQARHLFDRLQNHAEVVALARLLASTSSDRAS